MKRSHFVIMVFIAGLSVSPGYAQPSGREVIQRVLERDAPKTSEVRVKMLLVDKRGLERVREFMSYSKETAEGRKSVMKFLQPADVKGMGYLQIEHKKGKDEQFIYLPELKRARRVAGSARRGSFFGSDLTYEDLESRDVDEDEHKLLREEKLDDSDVYVVESKPKEPDSTEYSKVIQWVRKDNYIPVRVEFYKNGGLHKVLTVEKIDKVDNYWTAMRTRVHTEKTNHTTLIEIVEVKNNKPIADDVFSERFLSRE